MLSPASHRQRELEKGGVLYNLRRFVPLQQKQNGLRFVRSLSGDEGMI